MLNRRNRRLIDELGNSKLYQEIQQPDGAWITIYEGEVYMDVQGVMMKTPDDPAWNGQAEARGWLMQS